MCLFGLGVIALAPSTSKQPLRALSNMLLRVGHSPMSNETAAGARRLGGARFVAELGRRCVNALVWLAAIVGVVFLYAVPQIYQLPTVYPRSSYTTAMMILDAVDWRRRAGGIVVWRAPSSYWSACWRFLRAFCLRPRAIWARADERR